jgi:ribosomal protein L32
VGKPKKRTSARKTGLRRSHIVLKLKRLVNKTSPVRIRTTKNESGKRKVATVAEKKIVKAVDKAAEPKKVTAKKPAPKK